MIHIEGQGQEHEEDGVCGLNEVSLQRQWNGSRVRWKWFSVDCNSMFPQRFNFPSGASTGVPEDGMNAREEL